MKKAPLLTLCAMLAASAVYAADANPKPGLWDMSARMERNGAAIPGAMNRRICLSQKTVKDYGQFVKKSQNATLPAGCPRPKMNRGGNRITLSGTCTQNGMTTTLHGDVAVDSEQVNSKFRQTMTEAGSPDETVVFETQMKFIASDCGNTEPIDFDQRRPR